MFIYENGNTLNLTFKGQTPIENPEVIIKGYEDGATLTVNGTVYGNGSQEFNKKANTIVYQRDNKLAITFQGVKGLSAPDVTIDEVSKDVFDVVVAGVAVKLTFTKDSVTAENAVNPVEVIDEPDEVNTEDETDPEEEPVEE